MAIGLVGTDTYSDAILAAKLRYVSLFGDGRMIMCWVVAAGVPYGAITVCINSTTAYALFSEPLIYCTVQHVYTAGRRSCG